MTHANTDNRSFLADELGIEAGLDGRCTISIRGAAKLLGVTHTSISKKLLSPGYLDENSIAKTPATNEVEARLPRNEFLFPESATIGDEMFSSLALWFAQESPQKRTKEAKAFMKKIYLIGVRAWLQSQAGYDGKVSDLVQSVEVDRLEMDAAIDEAVLERLTEANRIRTLAQAKLKSEYDRGLEVLGNRIRDLDAEVLRLCRALDLNSLYDDRGNRHWTQAEIAKTSFRDSHGGAGIHRPTKPTDPIVSPDPWA